MEKVSQFKKFLAVIDQLLTGIIIGLVGCAFVVGLIEEVPLVLLIAPLLGGLIYVIKVLALGLSYTVIQTAENSARTNLLLEYLINESQDKKSS